MDDFMTLIEGLDNKSTKERNLVKVDSIEADVSGLYLFINIGEQCAVIPTHSVLNAIRLANKAGFDYAIRESNKTDNGEI